VQKRWLGIVALCIAGAVAGRSQAGLAEPGPGAPGEYVVVQFAGGADYQQLRAEGAPPPTLEEQGFRQLAVPTGMTRDRYLAELRARPDVVSAEPDPDVYATSVPNDPYFVNQAPYLAQIGVPAAWDLTTGGSSVIIATLDTGLDLTHPEFAGRLWENLADAGSDGIDRDGNGCVNDRYGCRFVDIDTANVAACGYTSSAATGAVLDDHGKSASDLQHSHGTIVAGIAGAAGNNGAGVTGVAWTVKLMTVKVLDCGPGPKGPHGYMSRVAQGIQYAVRMGANVINLSLASDSPNDDIAPMRAALQMAQDAGVIVVAAAGNHGPGDPAGVGYPAAYTEFPNLIAVAAADNKNGNTWATYSNYGPAVDFAGPATGIVSTARTNLGLGNPYVTTGDTGGTSVATPFVTGMFALMMSRNSRLGAVAYIQIARDTASAAPPAPHGQPWAGSGIINIGAAVARVPMILNGSALRDWRDIPAGVEVKATIGGQECGKTATQLFLQQSRYDLRVRSESEQAGCGAPGKTVQLSIGGIPALPTFTWGGQNQDLALANRDVSTVSPPPGAVVVQTLNGHWSNVAHLDPGGSLPGSVSGLPTPWSTIYRWDPSKLSLDKLGGYTRFVQDAPAYLSDYTAAQTYDAYWVDAPAANVASVNPNPPPGRTIALQQGWNNFTYTGNSREVSDALSSIAGKYSEVLQYDNATETWLAHTPGLSSARRFLNDFGGLFKLKVYWVYMTEAATLTMN
jgi:hypothetical protein